MGNITSQGTTIGIGDAASREIFTTIPQVTSMSGPDGSATEINVTNLSSTAQEFILGLKDEGSGCVYGNRAGGVGGHPVRHVFPVPGL